MRDLPLTFIVVRFSIRCPANRVFKQIRDAMCMSQRFEVVQVLSTELADENQFAQESSNPIATIVGNFAVDRQIIDAVEVVNGV